MGGNVAMAIMLTVVSNLLAVLTIPLVLPLVLGGAAGGLSLDPATLLRQLVQIVLAPTLLGVLVRTVVPGADRAGLCMLLLGDPCFSHGRHARWGSRMRARGGVSDAAE